MESEKLQKTIDAAAYEITMLTAGDSEALEGLQERISQICSLAEGMEELEEASRDAMREKAAVAAAALGALMESTAGEAQADIAAVSAAIVELQGLVESGLSGQAEVQAQAELQGPEQATAGEMRISEDDLPLVVDFIAEANEHIETAEAGMLALEAAPSDKEALNKIFRSFHTIKGMAGFLNLEEIQSLSHAAENLLDLARKDQLTLRGSSSDVTFASIDMLKEMLEGLKNAAESGGTIVRMPQLAGLLARLKSAADGETEPAVASEPEKSEEASPQEEEQSGASAVKRAATDEKIKVSTSRLDSLMNMVGELVIAQLMVAEETTGQTSERSVELGRKVSHQGKIVRELQELAMSMRMVPISGVFQKMSRLVRDLSQKAGKAVNLTISGEETELDRSIVDKVSDPLVHMIRNSVDHGIEPAEKRKAGGKPATGQVHLRAFHQAGNIVIEIADDGKGLDPMRIRAKAVESGLIDASTEMSDEEIYKLIFHPGLSTAEKITSVSGRGVGMDVVKKNIELLRGKIDIRSQAGKGTTFTIRLPLTLAIIDGQIVRVGAERYIIPINSVVRSLRPRSEEITTVQQRGEMAMIRGELIPVVRLGRMFHVEGAGTDPAESLLMVVEEDGRRCALMVDDLLGQQQVVIKSLGDGMGNVQGVSGGAIMGDGRVCLILDVRGLVEISKGQE